MAPPPSIVSRTLRSITLTKIHELEKLRSAYETRKSEILQKAASATNQHDRINSLVSGCKGLDSEILNRLQPDLSNMTKLVNQSKYDGSFPNKILDDFEIKVKNSLDIHSRRLGLATLYSRLVCEWMENTTVGEDDFSMDVDGNSEESFEVVEKHKERLKMLCDKFEKVCFTPLVTDEVEIDQYLSSLFEGDAEADLKKLRSQMDVEGRAMLIHVDPISIETLKWCIRGQLEELLLSDEKKRMLQDLLGNDAILTEMKDVLNMRYADIENWEWRAGEKGIPVMPRPEMNGKYRIWMDEDVLQALFVHYVGIQWCIKLRAELVQVFFHGALSKASKAMAENYAYKRGVLSSGSKIVTDEQAEDRRCYYITSAHRGGDSLNETRSREFQETFFLSQLPDSMEHRIAAGYNESSERKAAGTSIKQKLLRLAATEVLTERKLYGSAAIVQTDLQWFATGLSHSSIYAMFRFIGMPEGWIAFFKTFLEAPLNLDDAVEGRTPKGPQIRRRGVPMAHAPEKLMGELTLFFMDLLVYKETGIRIYRLHDDIWLWGNPAKCAQAWTLMQKYAKVIGLEFNYNKTGSVYLAEPEVEKDQAVLNTLPKGPVVIGFLQLSAESGEWVLNKEHVDQHIAQLKRQLDDCPSILSWVQTWNSCVGRFFTNNFGEPAPCFGRIHVESILDTYKRMQVVLFGTAGGEKSNLTSHLQAALKSRFGEDQDIPDAFLYLPESVGGLGILNPFIRILMVQDKLTETPLYAINKYQQEQKETYKSAKEQFEGWTDKERHKRYEWRFPPSKYESESPHAVSTEEMHTFMSFEEFTANPEKTDKHLSKFHSSLREVPESESLAVDYKMAKMIPYDIQENEEVRWVAQVFGEELLGKVGGFTIVRKEFLPTAVLEMLRGRKVAWQMVL